jgi:hypothetical protein
MMVPPPTAPIYIELYEDTIKNPFGEEEEERDICYGAIYEVWRSTHAPLSSETLLQNNLAEFSRPIGVIGVFVPDQESPTGILKLLHGLASFPGTPGRPRDRMKVFRYGGYVSGLDISTVAFSSQQLNITPDVIVPGSLARAQQFLSEDPNNETLGHFQATDANMRTIKTRTMKCVPFEFLEPLLVADLTACQVFELIVPALMDAGLEYTCSRLVYFLTVALVQPTEERSEPYTLLPQIGTSGYVPGPEAISHRRESILYRDIPALRPAVDLPTMIDPALIDVARGVHGMVTEARVGPDHADNHREARCPRTIQEKLGEAIVDRLLLVCGVTNDDALPALYHELTARPRVFLERWVMQEYVDASCASQGIPPFEFTPTQVKDFNNFWFTGSSYFDIGSGLLPFSITPDDATSPAACTMLAADRGRADAFDIGADPESGAIAPSILADSGTPVDMCPKAGLRLVPSCAAPVVHWAPFLATLIL